MSNTINACAGRQNVASFSRTFSLADFVDNSNSISIALPINAVITRGSVTHRTNSNAGTSDELDVGYTGSLEAYKANINQKTATITALVPTGHKHTADDDNLILTRTAVGTTTALSVFVEFDYIVEGRVDFTQD